MTDKVRLSIDVPKSLREELRILSSLKGTSIQSVLISVILERLRSEAQDPSTRYSNIANKKILGLEPKSEEEDVSLKVTS